MRLIALIFLILLLFSISTFAQEVKKEDFLNNIPKEYDKLLIAYKQMVEFAFKWKELYENEAKINKELMGKLEKLINQMEQMNETIQRLDKTVDILQQIIFKLITPQVGVMGIYNLSDKSFSIGAGIKF